jgi:hypothetical protein
VAITAWKSWQKEKAEAKATKFEAEVKRLKDTYEPVIVVKAAPPATAYPPASPTATRRETASVVAATNDDDDDDSEIQPAAGGTGGMRPSTTAQARFYAPPLM